MSSNESSYLLLQDLEVVNLLLVHLLQVKFDGFRGKHIICVRSLLTLQILDALHAKLVAGQPLVPQVGSRQLFTLGQRVLQQLLLLTLEDLRVVPQTLNVHRSLHTQSVHLVQVWADGRSLELRIDSHLNDTLSRHTEYLEFVGCCLKLTCVEIV